MKLVSFRIATLLGETVRIGALVENRVIDLNLAYVEYLAEKDTTGRPYEVAESIIPPDMIGFFKGGDRSNEAARKVIDFVNEKTTRGESLVGPGGERIVHPNGEVKLLAPVPRPNSIRDTLSFEGHMKNFEKRTKKPIPELWYRMPVYYKGNPCTVIGPEEVILWPRYTERLDYELEFGVYIGKKGKNIRADEAHEYIAGYTVFNDVSARDVIQEEVTMFLGPAKGKDFDTGNVMGPCLVTPDELDVSDLKMIARINEEVWSEGTSSDMYWTFPKIIEHVSQSETLYPGDFIGSGTVANGCGDELNRWIQPGDVIELEVEGIGILRNQVIRESGGA